MDQVSFSERSIRDKKYVISSAQAVGYRGPKDRPHYGPKKSASTVFAVQRGWRCVSPILRSTSPGSVEIPGISLYFQRFWAGGIETDIYRLVRLGPVKVAPIWPHGIEVRSCRGNCLQGLSGTNRAGNIE
nr:MAG TPA: hypothetical protein [Caudoviricetes sp.]